MENAKAESPRSPVYGSTWQPDRKLFFLKRSPRLDQCVLDKNLSRMHRTRKSFRKICGGALRFRVLDEKRAELESNSMHKVLPLTMTIVVMAPFILLFSNMCDSFELFENT